MSFVTLLANSQVRNTKSQVRIEVQSKRDHSTPLVVVSSKAGLMYEDEQGKSRSALESIRALAHANAQQHSFDYAGFKVREVEYAKGSVVLHVA